MRKALDGDRRLWLALAAVATIAFGSYALAPAIGGGLLTKKKAKRLFYKKPVADQRFAPAGSSYSKSETDSRFYTKTEADSRFPSASGAARITTHGGAWHVASSTVPIDPLQYGDGGVTVSVMGMVTVAMEMSLSLPQTEFGRTMRLSGFELCYEANGPNASLSGLNLSRERATPGDPSPSGVAIITDTGTPRTDATCRTYAAASPISIDPSDEFHVLALLNFSAAGNAYLGRVSLLLQP